MSQEKPKTKNTHKRHLSPLIFQTNQTLGASSTTRPKATIKIGKILLSSALSYFRSPARSFCSNCLLIICWHNSGPFIGTLSSHQRVCVDSIIGQFEVSLVSQSWRGCEATLPWYSWRVQPVRAARFLKTASGEVIEL